MIACRCRALHPGHLLTRFLRSPTTTHCFCRSAGVRGQFSCLRQAARQGCRCERVIAQSCALETVGPLGRAPVRSGNLPLDHPSLVVCLCHMKRMANPELFRRKDPQSGWTPLRFAVQYGHTSVIRLLLKNGAEVNTRFSSNKTALHQACYDGNWEICELLLEAGLKMMNAHFPFLRGIPW